MKGYLKLWLHDDGDGTGDLLAEVRSRGFAGTGQGFVHFTELVIQAGKFSQYPFPENAPAIIEGESWLDGIKEKHLHISAQPADQRGTINLRVKLTEPPNSVSVEFHAEYEQMRRFYEDLIALVRGDLAELVFQEL